MLIWQWKWRFSRFRPCLRASSGVTKYCAGQVGVFSAQISPQMLRRTSSCFDCLTKPIESEIEDAIQAMTCDMYIYIYTTRMYTYIPSSTYPVNSSCSNLSAYGRSNMSMQNGRLAQLGTDCSRPEVCELEGNHHYHPDEFGSCHPG